MARLTFYFDPTCPWAWRTSLWVREARTVRDIQVEWKVFSLRENTRAGDVLGLHSTRAPIDAALRTAIQARAAGGNEAVDRLYLALGRARHDRREDLASHAVIEAALQEADLDPALLGQALDDMGTDEAALAEHREGARRFAAFGVPWLVLEDTEFGFYGPIITSVPEGEAAGQLWDHTAWLLTQPYLYEFKRNRG